MSFEIHNCLIKWTLLAKNLKSQITIICENAIFCHMCYAVSPLRHTMGTNPFRLFLVWLSPAYTQNMNANGVRQLGMFPRKRDCLRTFSIPPEGINLISFRFVYIIRRLDSSFNLEHACPKRTFLTVEMPALCIFQVKRS